MIKKWRSNIIIEETYNTNSNENCINNYEKN